MSVSPNIDISVTLYPNQLERVIGKTMSARTLSATQFVRRTVRAAVSQPGPHVKLGGRRRQSLGASAVGDPPFRRTGRLYGAVGFDFTRHASGMESVGRVGVSSYGMEVGSGKFGGRLHPHLKPVAVDNERVIGAILEGRISAPQIGDIGKAAHRQPIKATEVRDGRKRQRTTYDPERFTAYRRGQYRNYQTRGR